MIGVGCMRAFIAGDEERGADAIRAAIQAGAMLLDTARTYAESERVIGRLLKGNERVRVVTKGGMTRDGNIWKPDGRARSLREDCEASLRALDGVPIDTYLVHAPDPAVPWTTTVRALAKLKDEKLVKRIGVCNVSRKQLDEALDVAPIEAVQVAFGAYSDVALRGGVISRCASLGLELMAHSSFGGPKPAPRLAKDAVLAAIAKRHGVSAYEIVLALMLDLHECIIPIAGANRAETARAIVHAETVRLESADRDVLAARFGWRAILAPAAPISPTTTSPEIVLLMGPQGAGKSTLAASYESRGYERLNRDARGGTLKSLHANLDACLASKTGATRFILDNTYTTRAMRQEPVAVARRHGAIVRGIWIDITFEAAQVNVIERMIAAHGRLLEPEEMARIRAPSALPPNALYRTFRELERPADDEGFSSLEFIPFERRASSRTQSARIDLDTLTCPHGGGPPRCWCRPPLVGLLIAYAAKHDVDLARSVVVGTSALHAKMAAAVGATYVRGEAANVGR